MKYNWNQTSQGKPKLLASQVSVKVQKTYREGCGDPDMFSLIHWLYFKVILIELKSDYVIFLLKYPLKVASWAFVI